jgi:hypothetical protein
LTIRSPRRAAVVDLVDRVEAADGVGGHHYNMTTGRETPDGSAAA